MSNESSHASSVLSRGEIENACLLSSIPDEGCALSSLPAQLGLSPLLLNPIAEAIDPLVKAGWIQIETNNHLHLTEAGRTWLKGHCAHTY